MRTIQKLEICAGFATLIIAITFFYTDVLFEAKLALNEQLPITKILFEGFLLYIFPALLTFVGSFIHAVRKKCAGFVLLLVGGTASTLLSGLLLISTLVAHYRYGWGGSLLAAMLGVLALLTIYFALRARKLFALPL